MQSLNLPSAKLAHRSLQGKPFQGHSTLLMLGKMDTRDRLSRVQAWWSREGEVYIRKYENRQYPESRPPNLRVQGSTPPTGRSGSLFSCWAPRTRSAGRRLSMEGTSFDCAAATVGSRPSRGATPHPKHGSESSTRPISRRRIESHPKGCVAELLGSVMNAKE